MEAANLPSFLKIENAKTSDICVIFARNYRWPRNWRGLEQNCSPGLDLKPPLFGGVDLQGRREPQRDPGKHSREASLGKKILKFFFQSGAFCCNLYVWATAGFSKRREAPDNLPSTPFSRRAWVSMTVIVSKARALWRLEYAYFIPLQPCIRGLAV